MKRIGGSILGLLLAACGTQAGTDSPASDPCSLHVRAGADDQVTVQSALLGAATGSVICLEAGTYHLTDGLSLGAPGLTLRSSAPGAIFDFSQQGAPAPGLDVTGDDVTLEGIELRGSKGTALRVLGADNVRVLGVRITWPDGPAAEEAHGISLVDTSNTLVKDTEVVGAGGTGIRSLRSIRLVIEGASLRDNQEGIRIDGGFDVEVMGTDLQANRMGLVVSAGQETGGAERIKVHNNLIEGSLSSPGAGLLLSGPCTAEIHGNTIRRNAMAGLLVRPASSKAEAGQPSLHVHDNRFDDNGSAGLGNEGWASGPQATGADVVVMESDLSASCFTDNAGSVLLDGSAAEVDGSLEAGCPLPPLPSISL